MKRFLIIYHLEDNDGVCSAAIIKHYLVDSLGVSSNEIDLIPATYNLLNKLQANGTIDSWPNEYGHIIMTDISFNDWKAMKWLHDTFKENFTWIDHHAPVIKLSKEHNFDMANGIRDISNSAIWNTYKYLYDPFLEGKIPLVLHLLSAWDSWTYKRYGIDPGLCRAFNRGFTIESGLSLNWWLERMDMALDTSASFIGNGKFGKEVDRIYKVGLEACAREDFENKEMVRVNGDKTWEVNGIPAVMVAVTGPTNSMMFSSLQVENPEEADIRVAAVFKHCNDGNWTLSLYNIYDFGGDTSNPFYFHCGKYLQEKYNGGGHEGAAGCTLSVEQFCKLLKSKKI